MLRFLTITLSLLAFVVAPSETLVSSAKVVKLTDRGMIVQIGTEPLAVEDDSKTRFWRAKSVAKREDFKPGEAVVVRVKTDEDPPELREVADEATWKWLEAVRKNPQRGKVEKLDSKYLTVSFGDGSKFAYRVTEKTDIELKGKVGSLSDLSVGMAVYVKGRTLPTLDTWAVLITDEAIPTKEAKSKSDAGEGPKKAKTKPLDSAGKIEGRVTALHQELRMFDVDQNGRILHISYSASTVFTLDGKSAKATDLALGQFAVITYRRDKNGRIMASRVDLQVHQF